MNTRSVALASKVLSYLGKRSLVDAFPALDANGKLPVYTY
jgi:hypothetical protein